MNIFWTIFFWCSVALYAAHPKTFTSLAKSYDDDLQTIEVYKKNRYFQPYYSFFDAYQEQIESCFALGFLLDRAIENSNDTAVEKSAYLGALRALEKEQNILQTLYVDTVHEAISQRNIPLFTLLLNHPMAPLQQERLRQEVLRFYALIRSKHRIAAAEALLQEQRLDAYSRQVATEEQQAYEEHLRVLTASQAKKIRHSGVRNRRNSVLVSTKNVGSDIEFYAHNRNAFAVTMTLTLKQLKNCKTNRRLPLYIELGAHSNKKVLRLKRIDAAKPAHYESRYGWVMGLASAEHDANYRYLLPFQAGKKVRVSQGFNGRTSHNGYSRYAVDFAVPVGTPVYAARGGVVVAVRASGSKGALKRGYGKYANYIVIEHSDGTLGKYYHLKKGGVRVRVGSQVRAGELIGYSGNTGYTSGPHLHFSVSKVDPKYKQRPITLPFQLQTAQGVVTTIKRGDRFMR